MPDRLTADDLRALIAVKFPAEAYARRFVHDDAENDAVARAEKQGAVK